MAELEIKPTSAMKLRVSGVMACAGVITGVLVWLLTGGGAGLFARKVNLKTYMPDATGLEVGGPVRLDGIQIGQVKGVTISGYLDMQRAVRVDLRVEEAYLPKLPSDSQTSIGSDTLIGSKFVGIAAGKSKTTAGEGTELPSEPEESAADKADLIFAMQDSMKKVDSMLQDIGNPQTPIGHYVVGDEEYGKMLRSIDSAERGMRTLVARGNPTGDMVFTTSIYANWDKSIKQMDDSMQAIQRGEGVAGHLYVSDEQYNTILSQIRDLRKSLVQFHADMEKAGPGLRDEETYQKIVAMLTSTDKMISSLNRGEGQAGELLNNPELYESLVGSLKSLDELLRDFDANPKKYLRAKVF
jgi:phospholipid/cholesterol/gamma-HCH transport system substrate-binding protein